MRHDPLAGYSHYNHSSIVATVTALFVIEVKSLEDFLLVSIQNGELNISLSAVIAIPIGIDNSATSL